jgi:hypothetical protein
VKAILIPGGGAKILHTVYSMEYGYEQGKFDPSKNDYPIIADSAGGLVGYFLAIGYDPVTIADIFTETDFAKILMPWYMRWMSWKARLAQAAAAKPIDLGPLADWINKNHPPGDVRKLNRLFISAWHDEYNTAVIFCNARPSWALDVPNDDIWWEEGAYLKYTAGHCLTAGMTLPGLRAPNNQYWWMDGGVGEHPFVSILPQETELLYFGLSPSDMTPRHPVLKQIYDNSELVRAAFKKNPSLLKLVNPKSTSIKEELMRGLRMYDIKAHKYQKRLLEGRTFTDMDPALRDLDSMAFNLSEKEKMLIRSKVRKAVKPKWERLSV